jgi:iron(III) transport system permease protein
MQSVTTPWIKTGFDGWGGKCLHRFGLFLFMAIVFGPLLALMADAGQWLLAGNSSELTLMVPTGRRLALLIRSLGLAASVATGGIIAGILVGSLLWQWHTRTGVYVRWFVVLLIAVPPYVHALTWMSVADAINSLFQPTALPCVPMHGWLASWWVQLAALTPISIGMTLIGLESIDPDLMDAARLMRTDVHVLMNVVLPLAAPMILAGGGFIFVISLTDYSIPSLFQSNVYPLEIFAEFSATNEPARAFLLALPLLIITVFVVSSSQAALRNAALKPIRHINTWAVAPLWPAWLVCLQRLAAAFIMMQILVPLISLTLMVGSWGNMMATITSARNEIIFTSWMSTLAAMVSLPMALAAAVNLVKSDRQGRLWWLLVIAPLAVPAPLIGIGLITIWNKSFFQSVYGSSLMPILASLARFTPLATIVLLAQLRRIDPLLIDAARVFQPHRFKAWIRIHLPMLKPGLLASSFMVFVLSTGELGATLIVAPPGQATLTMRIYNYLHYGASESVAGLCLMMAVAALIAILLAVSAMGHVFSRA